MATFQDLREDLYKTFENTEIAKHCFEENFSVNASGFNISHPNGSITIFFPLMKEIPITDLIETAKEWGKKHNLITASFYKNGVEKNIDPQGRFDWRNKPAMSCKYYYGFEFFNDKYYAKKVYKIL